MGLIQAFTGALSGTFADQWKDILVPADAPATAGVIPAVQKGTNAGRGSNTKGSENIITNGSKIFIPDGYALILLQDNMITGFASQPGGYEFRSDDPNSQSIFAGDGILQLITQSFEKFKFGGIPGAKQNCVFVNMKEIPNNKFGTQSEIYWDDMYINAQVAAMVRGTYTLQITDPITFLKGFVPAAYLTSGKIFDFADMDNDASEQLFTEVVGSLAAAFSAYSNDPARGNRMAKIQGDQMGFAKTLSETVEQNYQWKTGRGLEIIRVAIAAIEYDDDSKALLSDVKKADALSGARGNSFLQQSVARGMEAAGNQGGGAMNMGIMGMGLNAVGNGVAGLQQPVGVAAGMQAQPQAAPAEDPVTKLKQMKELLDAGVITQEEFDAAKAKFLGA
ncbi:MAG: SHOCT domain-containing protein [Lachnospiraceae bacterium]|nr:SHOCT domain-containing protein [Lachnospiraceae bacterium]MBR5943435.1 SHOCT domain-containing protein [Lachnospiraceae bacterium]